ncbi:leucine-rich repeat domain-containing protein [Cellulomonas fimi]|uniref:Leucine-rich repeat-containing protein n=1 Tax=Cellulomonas fimi (strain ATCC 484 / DSM 20113 / JCM 1341 / CCUG 24087 / LMG 16345 / NBRC 15513 / NCIMB 8980 / NCTC 7547 / NRS-133) TaxID=590998 RepID=F4H3X4_CELFA|nr:leucine-rich repeat domain-containing protein [Cellulomonas fimi]AEE44198.1 hypothetical protein Celf_0047 [Cellulomonas fimi ATCC 484]NNH05648.1 leucine-rich repeat domain-containing protein [Cellulomonas fimi]VEH25866.1 Internalin-A precursor [Cellulomonas fimi]
MPGTGAARRAGAAAVAVVGAWTAVVLLDDTARGLFGDALWGLLGQGQATFGDAFAATRGDLLPVLALALGLVPVAALVLSGAASAWRQGAPQLEGLRGLVGTVVVAVGAVVALGVGLLVPAADPVVADVAPVSWLSLLEQGRGHVGLWLALVAVGVLVAGAGVLGRRRGVVAVGAVVVAVGAWVTAATAAGWTVLLLALLRRYRGAPISPVVVLGDGTPAAGLVAVVALLVAVWCAVAAWSSLPAPAVPPRSVASTDPRAPGTSVPGPPVPAPMAAGRPRVAGRRLVAAWGVPAAIVLVVVLVVAAVQEVERRSPSVALADATLTRCVERSIGVAEGSGIPPERLDEVYRIDCPWRGSGPKITSLEGVERLTSVQVVDLTDQSVHSLAPLSALTGLQSLRLTGNTEVTDLTPLTGLPIENLGLSGTGVHDLFPLASTPTLQFVGLAATDVTDLGPLAASSGLVELDVYEAAVADLTPLANLHALTRLDARGNRVEDVTPLAGMAALDELWIGGNPVHDLRPLLDAPALLGVDVEGLDSSTPGIDELRAKGVYIGGLA